MNNVDEQKTAGMGDGPQTANSKVAFSSDQQEKVQELIDSAYKRAYSKAAGGAAESEEVLRLKHEVDMFRDYKKNSMILGAISRYNVVDAEEVAELIAPRLKVSEGGDLQFNGGAEASGSIDEFVGDWLSERPHHLRNSSGTGAGSYGAKFGTPARRYNLSDPSAWKTIPREDLDKLLKEGINVHGSQGQVFSFKDVKNPFREARKKKFNSGG